MSFPSENLINRLGHQKNLPPLILLFHAPILIGQNESQQRNSEECGTTPELICIDTKKINGYVKSPDLVYIVYE